MCYLMRKLIKRFKPKATVNVVRLDGVIGGGTRFGSGLNDTTLAPFVERAFRKGKPKAVALAINSPGGSPVQSALIAARIRRLAHETETEVYAFCEDVAASGGYWLATAADHIFVDSSSVVGSIGVISASFGFHELMTRQGIERRWRCESIQRLGAIDHRRTAAHIKRHADGLENLLA